MFTRRVFIGRPMNKEKELDKDFFIKVQENLIIPSIKEAEKKLKLSLKPFQVDQNSCQNILASIVQQIEMAEICIFDITNNNPNVLFEFGLRRSQEKAPFVLISCNDINVHAPFDITHERILYYSKNSVSSKNNKDKIYELARRIVNSIKRFNAGPRFVSTDYIYSCYGSLCEKDDLLSWVATWPAFPNSWHREKLLKCNAKNIIISGPVKNILQLPGIFWRLAIREERRKSQNRCMNIYGKDVPAIKFIVAGDETFLSPEVSMRTARYYRTKTKIEHKELFYKSLIGSRPIEESIYLLIHKKITDEGKEELSLNHIIEWFHNERETQTLSFEIDQYEERWILQIFEKWIKFCLSWCSRNRGWNILFKKKISLFDTFSVNINNSGRYLESRHWHYLRHEKPPYLPQLRLIVTNKCDQNCIYCPPENEDYSESKLSFMSKEDIKFIISNTYKIGFRKFSFTGGEPLQKGIGEDVISTLEYFHNSTDYKDLSIIIQTNGLLLNNYVKKLKLIDNLSLKVSWHMNYSLESNFTKTIENASDNGIQIGLNIIITKQNINEINDIINWAHKYVRYVKLLDLNWYPDIGKRNINESFRNKYGDIYWIDNYYSPIKLYKEKLQKYYGTLSYKNSNIYGIPMLETKPDSNQFFIRIKDSSIGSYYSNQCRSCIFFLDKRRCQEGLYQIWITPNMQIKLCRHRKDLYVDISDIVKSKIANELQKSMVGILDKYYVKSKFIGLSK